MNRANILFLSLSLSLSVFANESCDAFYEVQNVASAILAESRTTGIPAFMLIQSPRFAKMVLAGKKQNPDFMKQLKEVLNPKAAPVEFVPTPTKITTDFSEPNPERTTETKHESEPVFHYVQPVNNNSKIQLRLGEFSYEEQVGKFQHRLLEMTNQHILAIDKQEVTYLKPAVDATGKIEYAEYRKVSIPETNFVSNLKIVNPDLVVGVAADATTHIRRLVLMDPNNPANTIRYGNINRFLGNQVKIISSTEFLVLGTDGFVIYTLPQNGKPESVSPVYAPPSHPGTKDGKSLTSVEILPDGDILAATSYTPEYVGDKPHTEFSTIQHWIRNSDGTYTAAKEFSIASYTHRNGRDYLLGSHRGQVSSIKLLPGSVLVTADNIEIKTWKWNDSSKDLVLISSTSPFKNTAYGWINGMEYLASGEILANIARGSGSHPVYNIDTAGNINLATSLTVAAKNYASGDVITPLSHGGMIAHGGNGNVWLWTRKP